MAFIGLFALLSATIYHISQTLTLLIVKNEVLLQEKIITRNIKVYNACMIATVLTYFALLLTIFFIRKDIQSQVVLSLNLGFHVLMILIYTLSVLGLFRNLSQIPTMTSGAEITSIKSQFVAILVGFSI